MSTKIVDDVRAERFAYMKRFGTHPNVVTIPMTRRRELADAFLQISGLYPVESDYLKFMGMDVRFSAANSCVACSHA